MYLYRFGLLIVSFLHSTTAPAEMLTIAVASNFARPARALIAHYEESTGNTVRLTTASTGKLYAQITNGAPFDILLGADSERPRLLEESGAGVAGTRFTYAIGGLVLWSRDPGLSGQDCKAQLGKLGSEKLAIANPLTAPYGLAARETLQAEGLWAKVQRNLVFGENISQTLHFVVTGNASLGFVAASQAADSRLPDATCTWQVPTSMHAPIQQQAILLGRASASETAADFMRYLRGSIAAEVIAAHGYEIPR